MSPRDLHRLDALFIICAALAACKSQPSDRGDTKPSPTQSASSGSATTGRAAPLTSSHALEPNAEFFAELQAVAAKCTYLAQRDTISCASSNLDPLKTKIGSLGPVALETLLSAVLDGPPPLATLAATQMRNIYDHSLGPSLEKAPIPERVVSALITALAELPTLMAHRLAPAATFVATREGRLDSIVQVIESRPELRMSVLPKLMRYSRLRALGEVQKWAKADNENVALSALEAPRLMDDWTDEERAQLAPWLKDLLTHKSNEVRGQAAALLLDCGDDAAAHALAWLQTTINAKRLTRQTIFAFGRHCRADKHTPVTAEELAKLASSPSCVKIENALDRVAADEHTGGGLREDSLQMLTAAWPQRALRRAQTLTNHSDPHLAQIARNVIKLVNEGEAKAK